MRSLINKTVVSLRQRGLGKTLIKGIHYFTGKTLEDRFTDIYYGNGWTADESVSGQASTVENTFKLRRQLPELFDKFEIRSIFDAPCGDFNWMQHVIRDCNNVAYVGGDIVAPMIDALNANYSGPSIKFIHVDLTKRPSSNRRSHVLPRLHVSLVICRHFACSAKFRALGQPLSFGLDQQQSTNQGSQQRYSQSRSRQELRLRRSKPLESLLKLVSIYRKDDRPAILRH